MNQSPNGPRINGRSRCAGFSLSELVVVITLMGLVATIVVATLRVTIGATVSDRDHAVAFAWLQAASDEIHQEPRVSCSAGTTAVRAAYQSAADAAVVPPMWAGNGATISVTDIEYLGKTSVDADFEWSSSFCFEGAGYSSSPLYTQRVTVEVSSPGGRIVQTLQMVKSE